MAIKTLHYRFDYEGPIPENQIPIYIGHDVLLKGTDIIVAKAPENNISITSRESHFEVPDETQPAIVSNNLRVNFVEIPSSVEKAEIIASKPHQVVTITLGK